MKLQQKTALIFIALLIILMTLVCVFSSIVILSSYADLEQQYTAKDLQQAVTRIDDETNSLSTIVSDWGPWDDSYNFVKGTKPDFIITNLAPDTFNNLRVNVIIITNRNGDILYSGAYNFSSRMMVTVPDDLVDQLGPKKPLLDLSDPRGATQGLILLADHPMIIVSRPIVRTDFSGEPQGVVIMGRYIDSEEVNRLARLTRPSLTFFRVDDPALPPDLLHNLQEQKSGDKGIIQLIDRNTIVGYALLKDIYGRDALILGISDPRSIYQQGLLTTFRFIGIILIAGLVFGLFVMFLLDKLVLCRLNRLVMQVHDIGNRTRKSDRVEIGGEDEFSGLAWEINRMLDTIDTVRHKVQVSETRFRELAELLPQIIFEIDTEGNLLYINKAGAEQFRITEKMIEQGINISGFLSHENIEQMKRELEAVTAGSPSLGEVYTIQRPDGTFLEEIISTSPIKKEGKVTGFRGIVVDVTELTRLGEQLEESTKLLTCILQASPVGVFRLNSSGHVTFVNETFSKITGITFEKIRGTNWVDILPQEERIRVLEEIGESIREQKTSRVETRYIHPDGTTYWLFGQTVPLIDKEGKFHGWVGTITDVTEQNKTRDALKENEEKYRALTENTSDILFSTDMDGIITFVSPQVNKYGFLVEEVIGKSLRILIHPADINRVENNMSRDLEKNAQFVSQFRLVDKWGTTYWFEEKSTLRLDISGKPVGIYGILRDVTERKRVEDAIDIANKKLNLMNQITRHDILNTITGLLGCVDMAKATNSLEEREQLLNDIRDLTRVIQRHITFTREYQEVGVHLPQWQNVDVILNKVLQNFQKSGIVFSVEFEKIEIYADPLLEKVFYNLVENAVRYGINLTTISIYPHISDKGLSLVFEDDGVGVEAGQKSEIFKRGVGKNTGMGLFLTAEILAITGITIEENGIFKKGARFEIRIPNGTWRFTRD
ncbi:MAG: PAS domain S-box protein [Methanoregula sp.]